MTEENELLKKALEIRKRDHVPFDMVLDAFIDSLGDWKEYVYINLAYEFRPKTKKELKELINFHKDHLKRWKDD